MQYTSAYKYISWNGSNKKEPEEPTLEQPESVRQALEIMEADGGTVANIAGELHMSEEVFLDVVGRVYKPKPSPPSPAPSERLARVIPFQPSRRPHKLNLVDS